jgi:hypothetical protein
MSRWTNSWSGLRVHSLGETSTQHGIAALSLHCASNVPFDGRRRLGSDNNGPLIIGFQVRVLLGALSETLVREVIGVFVPPFPSHVPFPS